MIFAFDPNISTASLVVQPRTADPDDPCPPPPNTVKASDINGDGIDDWLLAEDRMNGNVIQEWCVNGDAIGAYYYFLVVNKYACGKCPYGTAANRLWRDVIMVNTSHHVRTEWTSVDLGDQDGDGKIDSVTYVCDVFGIVDEEEHDKLTVSYREDSNLVGVIVLQPPPLLERFYELPGSNY